MTGPRKAAVVLLSLEKSQAARVMAQLTSEQVEQVTTEMARLGKVPAEVRQRILQEFCTLGLARLDAPAEAPAPERAHGAGNEGTPAARAAAEPFACLQQVDAEIIAGLVAGEHPQTIALILSHLPAALSAAVLARLPAEGQLDVVRRMATIDETLPEVVRDVERTLEARLWQAERAPSDKQPGITAVAQLLSSADRRTHRSILRNLEQDHPELVEQIRQEMYSFDDLLQADEQQLKARLPSLDTGDLALALFGASPELKTRIERNLSSRDRSHLADETRELGPVRIRDLEQAQRRVADHLLSPAPAGRH